jgi:probable F420-dependent oxidoreductase
VCANDFRHPLELAREAATLDLVSGGRFELGIGAGWNASDYHEIGIAFDLPRERVARLEEAVHIIKRAWTGEPLSWQGRYYAFDGYANYPPPVQTPGPPLLIGSGSRRLLAFAARNADIVALAPKPVADGSGLVWEDISFDAAARKVSWVSEAAAGISGNPEISCNVVEVGTGSAATGVLKRLAEQTGCGIELLQNSPHVWIGSIDEICERLVRWREQLGISYFAILGDAELLEAGAPIVRRLSGT